MSKHLDELAAEVAAEQAAIDGQGETTRQRVLRVGKLLRQLQKEQKVESKETGQTWDQWIAEQKSNRVTFPSTATCRHYILIAKYPGAYAKGMSIQEAYKMAGKWKKNGGSPPKPEKVTIKKYLPAQVGTACGRCLNKLEKYNAIEDWTELAIKEKWSEDAFVGFEEVLRLCRQEITHSLKKLQQVREAVV